LIERRSFLTRAAWGALGSVVLSRLGAAAREGTRKVDKVGLQLYTVRKEMAQDFAGTLAKVAAIGFKEVEFAGYFNQSPDQVKAALGANKLSAPSAHVPLRAIRDQLQKTIDTAAAIGHSYLVCPYLTEEERKSLDDYKKVAETLNRAGEAGKKAGIQFCYHNHDFEFATLDGNLPYDVLLKETDPKLVMMELDLYWIIKAGHQPDEYFSRYPGRFPLLHVKDMDNTPKKFFTEVGRGTIDFKKIFAQGQQAGVKHYFVEQDQCPGSPFDSIKISYDYLKRLRW
jgi:sugar phosphate isomerase/epimerase